MLAQQEYRVRQATPTDLEAVRYVLAESNASSAASSLPDRQSATWERMMSTSDQAVYLAERGDEPVGTATSLLMHHLTYGCAPTAFIEAMLVKRAHRRRGVGRLLLQRALQDARAAGCLKVQLLSHKRHATDGAHRLYEAAGFTAEAEGFRLHLQPWPIPS